MAYDTLKAAIEQTIKPNGNQAITGQVLQNILLEMVNLLGSGAVYGGEIVPASAVPMADTAQAYIAKTQGTYTNHGGLSLAEGEVAIISNVTGKWAKTTIYTGNDGGGGGDANAAEMLLAVRAAARALGASVWKSGDLPIGSRTLGMTEAGSDIWIYLAASGDEAITASYTYRSGGAASQVTIPQNGTNILVVDGTRVGSDDTLSFSAAHDGCLVAAVAVRDVSTAVVKGQFDPFVTWKENMETVRAASGIETEAAADSVTIKLDTTMLDKDKTPGPQQTAQIAAATEETAGLMSAADKAKLEELAAGGGTGGASPLVLTMNLTAGSKGDINVGATFEEIEAAVNSRPIIIDGGNLICSVTSVMPSAGVLDLRCESLTDKKVIDIIIKEGTAAGTCNVNVQQGNIDKTYIGLGNVTNDAQVKRSEMGKANGVATLGADGKVPAEQLPSFVTGSGVTGIIAAAELPDPPADGILYIVTGTEE